MDIKAKNVVTSGLYTWELAQCIGKGTCSQVFEAGGTFSGQTDSNRSFKAAVKIFNEGKNYEASGTNEVEILQYLNRQGVTLYEKYVVGLLDHFVYNNRLCLALERLNCNLYHSLMKNSCQGLPLFVIRKCGQDVLEGLSFLAGNLVVHGDLKLTNIMWNANKSVFQLVDFGISFLEGHQPYQPVQSPGYSAPEAQKWNLLISQGALEATNSMCTCACDLWSFACVLLHLYTGKLPFLGFESLREPVCKMCCQNSPCIYTSNIKKNIALPLDQRNVTPALHESLMDLVLRLMKCRPDERMKAADARSHKFLVHDNRPSLTSLLLLPTRILQLNNMFHDPAEFQDPDEYRDFVCDVEEECAKFGAVETVVVPLDRQDCRGKVFVKYREADDCVRAQEALAWRTFNNNTVITSFFPAADFEAGNFY